MIDVTLGASLHCSDDNLVKHLGLHCSIQQLNVFISLKYGTLKQSTFISNNLHIFTYKHFNVIINLLGMLLLPVADVYVIQQPQPTQVFKILPIL